MRVHELRRQTVVAAPLDEVFAFFADAGNLESLTPAFLRFRIVTPLPIVMRKGTVIDYRLRLRGVPVRWRTEITAWEPGRRFVDRQVKGPYRLWEHEHVFRAVGGKTVEMHDHVRYAHCAGGLLERWLVRPDLERIFDEREKRLQRIFRAPLEGGEAACSPPPGEP